MDPLNRRTLLARSPAALGLGLGLAAAAAPAAAADIAERPNEQDVRAFGAVGDGRAESADRDTRAFLEAIAAAKSRGGIVRVPMGAYALNRPILLEDQHLVGHAAGGWNADPFVTPSLLILQSDRAAITMRGGSSIHGLTLVDSVAPGPDGVLITDTDRRFAPRPPAIRVEGQASITNVKIAYPFDGIECSDQTENGRTNIENVFIISPGRDGLYVTNMADVPTLRNVEAWCNIGPSTGAGFRFGQNDQVNASGLFAYAFQVGFSFGDSPTRNRGTTGNFVDCSSDTCMRGWVIRGHARIGILGGDNQNHQESLQIQSRLANVRVQGAFLLSNGAPAIACDEADSLLVQGCHVAGGGSTRLPHVRIGAGEVIRAVISGCQVVAVPGEHVRPGIEVLPSARQVVVSGNIVSPGNEPRIVVRRGPGSEVVVADNLGDPVLG